MKNHGYTVAKKPTFNLPTGNLKPEIVAINNTKENALVIDVQVITDSFNLETANSKTQKYSRDDLKAMINDRYMTIDMQVEALTLKWKGIWSRVSATRLLKKKVISKNDLALISTRALIGTYTSFTHFNKSTSTRHGIG